MSRRILLFAAAAALALSVLPAYAHSHVVAQRTVKKQPTVYLSHGLAPGHTYRLQVTSGRRRAVFGFGFEYYTYVSNRRLYAGNHSLQIHGTTPASLTFSQPVGAKLAEWDFAVNIQIRTGRGLTVKLIDLGKHR